MGFVVSSSPARIKIPCHHPTQRNYERSNFHTFLRWIQVYYENVSKIWGSHSCRDSYCCLLDCGAVYIVTCIPIARQWDGKHIPATHEHAIIGRLLLGNGAVNRFRQQYRQCFPWGPCNVVIRSVRQDGSSSSSSSRRSSAVGVQNSSRKRIGSSLRNWQLQEIARKELDYAKKTSRVNWSDSETVIKPLPGYGCEDWES
jgi:hypothetical protein